ncbi:CDP-diacylglycerol--glycerol-3-phosphate 3-phosphatidyltransferase [Ceratocystis lukuohia]|uniref:CDP-diacylglycerol--glycerol-3-phosphate 3-phosphatidyltransferase n=1 Tax=Ceratocystis lukuohia TaxID=2019550 RepID=A0ABR4MDC8_9PEZI
MFQGLRRCAPRLCGQTRQLSLRSTLYQPQCRMYSSANGSASSVSADAAAGYLGAGSVVPIVTELDQIAPSFNIDGSQIQVIQSPAEFYKTLKDKILSAKRRVFLSTLYIGKSERDLINTIQAALRTNPELQVSILTDALRGTREAPQPSSASLLAPLISEFRADRVEIRMYHTPNLTGLRKKHIPKRINEGWGLQHMKLYGMDDEIILSGANLSMDYFTNRQDRYHLFSSKHITEHFSKLHHATASLSYLIKPSHDPAGFEMVWPNTGPAPVENPAAFVAHATSVLTPLICLSPTAAAQKNPALKNTRVYMLSQMSQLLQPDSSTELPAVTHILQTLSRPEYTQSSWTFTAGYFNPAPSLTKLLLGSASKSGTVITASPHANGFFQSKGVSGMLPDAYTYLARRFLRAVHTAGRDSSITLKEWRRGCVTKPDGWTYHAKGLWVTLPGDNNPAISIVGSSNYTKRSYSLDLEAGALIITRDEELKRKLGREQQWLQEYASKTTVDDLAKPERRVGIHVRLAMWFVQAVGGAL